MAPLLANPVYFRIDQNLPWFKVCKMIANLAAAREVQRQQGLSMFTVRGGSNAVLYLAATSARLGNFVLVKGKQLTN